MQSIRSLLRLGEAFLVEHGVPNSRRNAEWILSHTLGCGALDLYVHSRGTPPRGAAEAFWERIRRRARREPLQYILGETEFMSLPFAIEKGVFVPRPDTEVLVEWSERKLREEPLDEPLCVLDVCCGSGIIAVSLAHRIPNLTAVAVDLSASAVGLTRANAARNGVQGRVVALEAAALDYLDPDRRFPAWLRPNRFAAVVCNPPYVETKALEDLAPEIRDHEPVLALDGGPDGLDFYRSVTPAIPRWLKPGGIVAFEIADTHAQAVGSLLSAAGFLDIETTPDYTGRDRVISGISPRRPTSVPRSPER